MNARVKIEALLYPSNQEEFDQTISVWNKAIRKVLAILEEEGL